MASQRKLKLVTAQQILDKDDLKREEVPTPEWAPDGTSEEEKNEYGVLVREMTASERDFYERSAIKSAGANVAMNPDFLIELKARTAQVGMINEDGSQMFKHNEIMLLGQKSAAALNRVVDVILRLSGMTKDEQAEIEGNSQAVPNVNGNTA